MSVPTCQLGILQHVFRYFGIRKLGNLVFDIVSFGNLDFGNLDFGNLDFGNLDFGNWDVSVTGIFR
jgi:hypothetical protein